MSDQSPLIVPMTVEALVVNNGIKNGPVPPFLQSSMAYGPMFDQLANAQPDFQSQLGDEGPYYNGVYVKWRLPAAFTTGVHDSAKGQTVFPPVPNRWLVVRCSGTDHANRTATAFIVESDALKSVAPKETAVHSSPHYSQQGAAFPGADQREIFIGRGVSIAGGWAEPGHSRHLTALAPGNHAFAYFLPACNNVFSFVDSLSDLGEVPREQLLSYMVAGWFSDSTDDPLSGATEATFTSIIEKLGWMVPSTVPFATSTLVYGFVDAVGWRKKLPSSVPSADGVTASIGNTAVEALTAMIPDDLDPQLLEALQLDMVEDLDQPDGAALLAEALQSSFFKRYSGGYTWTIVGRPHSKAPSPADVEKESAILAGLNTAQRIFDHDLRQLAALRAELYVMWWKSMNFVKTPPPKGSHPIVSAKSVQEQLDPTVKGTIAYKVAQLMATVHDATVPNGSTPAELRKAIEAYAKAHGLAEGRILKRSAAPSFYEVNNPVVVISGAGVSNITRAPKQVNCRFFGDGQLISFFQYGNSSFPTASSNPPVLSLDGVSGAPSWWADAVQSLYLEFFLLDPVNAALVAKVVNQPIDAVREAIWKETPSNYPSEMFPDPVAQLRWERNPWHPLLLRWEATYTPIPYDSQGQNWTFQEGEYVWNGSGAGGPSTALPSLQGTIILTPAAALNMQARVKAFIKNNPASPYKGAFESLLSDGLWDLLSQSLDGFNEQLCLGQPGAFISPAATPFKTNPSLPELLGGTGSYPPDIGKVPSSGGSLSPDFFQPWRSGQLVVNSLLIIDEWGQALRIVTPDTDAEVYAPAEFQPAITSNDALVNTADNSTVVSPAGNSLLQISSIALDGSTLTVTGKGFQTISNKETVTLNWDGQPVPTNVSSDTSLTASIPAGTPAGIVPVSLSTLPSENETDQANTLILPPALLQPAQLNFSFVSATDDSIRIGPGSRANPVCGWVVPNILDNSLLAFDSSGIALGEMSIDVSTADQPAIVWNNAPFSPYPGGLPEIQQKIPHFGPFLYELSLQSAGELTAVLAAINDTLWTTLPASSSFDQNLAAFIGRPLAMVRASLQFLLDGPPDRDPSWQYTFKPAEPAIETYEFGIQLGDVAQLEDGLIGYFMADDYQTFNVVQQTGAAPDGYMQLIGAGNYIDQPFDDKTIQYVSMLVDPRAAVNATTGILPTATLALPQDLVTAATANMRMMFRVAGALTDLRPASTKTPATILIPTRRMPGATWMWLENDEQENGEYAWTQYAVAANDANARLSPVAPVLRSGLLQLSTKGVES